MNAPSGEESAAILLQMLPPATAEQILSKLGEEHAARVRARMQSQKGAPSSDQARQALVEFFAIQRVSARVRAEEDAKVATAPAGTYSPVGKPGNATSSPSPQPSSGGAGVDDDPIKALREMDIARLVRVLQEEQISTIALVMSCLETTTATELMKRLPPKVRPELALRLSQPSVRNPELREQLARVIVQKCRKLTDTVQESSADERIKNLAMMLRGLLRPERIEIMAAMESADPETADRVKAQLYQFEDLLKVEDRALQTLLVELEMKTLAVALKGADESITAKVNQNISSRAREMLNEEMGLLGAVPLSRVSEARAKIVSVMRQFEEEGKITIEG